MMQLPSLERPIPSLAIRFEKGGIGRIGEQRHMAENIMEDVRLFEIVELFFRPDEGAGRKTPTGQMFKKKRRRG